MISRIFVCLIAFFATSQLQAQTLVRRTEGVDLQTFVDETWSGDESYVYLPPISQEQLHWGNPGGGDKVVFLYYAPGKEVADGSSSYRLEGPVLAMVLEKVAPGSYQVFATDTLNHELLIGVYPRTATMDSAMVVDEDQDGVKEFLFRMYGSMRCEVELEEINEETGEVEIYNTTATCDCYDFGVLRQVQENGDWKASFTMELFGEGDCEFLTMEQALAKLRQ